MAAWSAANGPETAEPAPLPPRGALTVHPRPELLADVEYVNAHRADPGVVVIDARNQEEFEGSKLEDAVARPGHIPGARNLDWTATLSEGKFLGRAALGQLLVKTGANPGTEIITYCRVGTRASVVYFVGRLLGLKVRLYDGSMNEWAARVDLPIVKGPP